jgi:hypothetical protein
MTMMNIKEFKSAINRCHSVWANVHLNNDDNIYAKITKERARFGAEIAHKHAYVEIDAHVEVVGKETILYIG